MGEYESWMTSWGAAPSTIRGRKVIAQKALREFGLEGLTSAAIGTLLSGTPSKPLKPWSRSTYHANLSDFCAWLLAQGYIDENPMDEVKQPKRPRPAPRPLTEAEIVRVLAGTEAPMRDWIILALYAGLRAHEVAKLRGEDVSPEGIYVVGKGGVAATLPCQPQIAELAERYPSAGYWFPAPNGEPIEAREVSLRVGTRFEELGIEGSLHRCRHAFATRLLRNGVNIRKVQRLMRHANLETTATYTAVDEDELMRAVMTLPPTG